MPKSFCRRVQESERAGAGTRPAPFLNGPWSFQSRRKMIIANTLHPRRKLIRLVQTGSQLVDDRPSRFPIETQRWLRIQRRPANLPINGKEI